MNLLGERWEAAILNVADRHFFYTQVAGCSRCCCELHGSGLRLGHPTTVLRWVTSMGHLLAYNPTSTSKAGLRKFDV